MVKRLKYEGKILAVSLGVGILFALGMAAYTYVYSYTTQRDIADNVIRFHVMAHGDSAEEQALKEYVRTELLMEFESTLATGADINYTRARLSEILPDMRAHAEYIIRRAGFDHVVTANMATVFFPTQLYGNIAFPPGNYEAVQIVIGSGTGNNWWCLMVPPLCYVDMTATETGRQQLSGTISEEGLRLLMHLEDPSTEMIVRFRIVEWWQNRRQPNASGTQQPVYQCPESPELLESPEPPESRAGTTV